VPIPSRHRITTTVPVRLPFDADGLLWYLRIRAVPEVEVVTGSGYRRTLRLPSGPAILGLEFGDSASVAVDLDLTDPADEPVALHLVHRLLDADADAAAIDAHLAADPALAPRVAAIPGIRVPGMVDGAEIVVRTVLGQQVSVAAARTAAGRLTALVGARLPTELAEPNQTRLFVSPQDLTTLTAADIGGPRRRAETLAAAARDLADGTLVVAPERDPAELTAQLVARPGIGPWTAQYIAMRVLGQRDELLTGDLALRTGAGRLGLPDTPRELAAHGLRWSPYRSYAGQHLWRASRLPAGA
jgi:AraC family transcriptional regulator of adaptative response / DNA-3-methyladenine glycosylase II